MSRTAQRTIVAALAGSVLALSLAGPGSAQEKGGSLRLLARAAAGTIDPHINYTLQYWQLNYVLYDGLVTFRKAGDTTGFDVVPDLAEAMPSPENDGRTYTFKLRQGIRFADGQDLTTDDVVASFQRIFKVSGPTAGTLYNGIVGADKCLASPASCTLEGGVVADKAAGTVTFNLAAPDGESLQKIAIPHAYIVPAATPATDQGTTPIPGTGPYMIQSYDPNASLKLVRNPSFKEWSADAQPDGLVDDISYDFGLTEEAAVTAVQNGDADWMFDPPPPDRLAEIGTQYADQVFLHPLTAMWYAPMNTNIPPFDNAKARQAVNYAIDRDALVKLFGGANLAQPVCQVLPPEFPAHVDYCPYTKDPGAKWSAPDMEKAKQLVAESGTAGQSVTIVPEDTVVSKSVGIYLQDVLNVLFSCASFHPGSDASINISGFCDKAVDAKMAEAFATAVKSPESALPIWSEVDRMVTDAAPAAVLFTPKRVDFVSSRVKNFTFSPQFYMILSKLAVE